jgi:hypothetical protein
MQNVGPTMSTLVIRSNPRITTFSLEGVATAGSVSVVGNAALQQMAFPSLTVINQQLIIDSNPKLRNLNGFETLTRFGTKLQVTANGSPLLDSIVCSRPPSSLDVLRATEG